MRHPLLQVVLLLFICGAVAGPAYACNYDEIKKKNGSPVAVVRELPKSGQGAWQAYTVVASNNDNEIKNKGWEPLRINVSYENLKEDKYCVNKDEKRRDFLDGEEQNCVSIDLMNEEKKKRLTDEIVPEAIKLHTDRLLVQRIKTPWKVPNLRDHAVCSHFTSPDDHTSQDVQDADYLLYVAAGPNKKLWSSPWAVTCAIDEQTKRPMVGAMNIHPVYTDFTRANVRFIAHQLAHALGFDYKNMMKEELKDKEENIRGVVKSAKVLEKAKEHYNCDSLTEVKLEHTTKGNTTSHWNRRNTKDELMSMYTFNGPIEGIGYYTALTIASFEDLGFYKGNFNMSEPMSWGYHAGCDFLEATCKEKDKRIDAAKFCTTFPTDSCTSDRLGLGICFQSPETTSNCPIFAANEMFFCATEGTSYGWSGLFGKDSWCLDVDYLKPQQDGENNMKQGMCAAVDCSDDGVVKVQLKEDGEWFSCPREDGVITPNGTEYPTYVNRSIKCPKYSEVCTVSYNGSSLVKPKEEKLTTPTTEENTVSGTTDTTASALPSSTAVSDIQSRPTNTQDNNHRTTTTPTTAVPNNAHTTGSSITDSTTPQGSINQKNNTMNIEIVSRVGNDHSEVTKVYTPLVLLVLVVSTLLISF